MSSDAPSTPAGESVLFQGDTAEGLKNLRGRLLDLSRNNRLLNFKHTAKSLRLFNLAPDWIYERLVTRKKELRLLPVPRPKPGALTPEQEEAFTALGKNARGDKTAPQARFIAETVYGLACTFELPCAAAGDDLLERVDPARLINTLYFPDELEARGQNIRNAARLAVEETGSNVLHLVLGFLEWFESDDSNQPNLAPLLLIPVQIRRTQNAAGHAYEFHLAFTEEELMPNLSLIEKLQFDFGFAFPVPGEEQTPERYFEACARAIKTRQDRWRICRGATLALLQFRKMVMHKDLDPANWPDPGLLLQNPRVSEFFEGQKSGDSWHADDFPIDQLPPDQRELPLIEDADSSQHSAILDALNGRDLVIQGPPGTGKSQTITNIIGAALEQGKTVLFVAEKLAALQVVKERLAKAGLGDFCLELHSENANKRHFYADLRRRLNARFPEPRDLDQVKARLRGHWDELKALVLELNEIEPVSGKTLQQILALAARSRLTVDSHQSGDGQTLSALFDLDKDAIDPARFEPFIAELERFQLLTRIVCPGQTTLDRHPWHGLQTTAADHAAQAEIIARLHQARDALDTLLALAGRFLTGHGATFELTTPNLQKCFRLADLLRAGRDCWCFGWLNLHASSGDTEADEVLACLGRLLNHSRQLAATLQSRRLQQSDLTSLGAFLSLSDDINSTPGPGMTLGRLRQWLTGLLSLEPDLPGISASLDELEKTFSLTFAASPADLELAARLIQLLRDADHVPGVTPQALLTPEFSATLAKAAAEAGQINAEGQSLTEDYYVSQLPGAQELLKEAAFLAGHRFFPFLSKGCREARQRLLVWQKDKTRRPGYKVTAAVLNRLADWKLALEEFEKNPVYIAAFGPAFSGITTDLAHLARARDWVTTIDRQFPISGSAIERRCREFLFSLSPDRLTFLKGYFSGGRGDALTGFCRTLRQGADYLKLTFESDPALAGFQSILPVAQAIKSSVDALSGGVAADSLPLAVLPVAFTGFKDLQSALAHVCGRRWDHVLGPQHYRGIDTSRAELARQSVLWRALAAATPDRALLQSVVKTMIERGNTGLDQWLASFRDLQRAYLAFDDAFSRFATFGGLAPAVWHHPDQPLTRTRDRIHRALAENEKLDHWLQFNELCASLRELGLGPVTRAILDHRVAPGLGRTLLDYLTWEPLARRLQRAHPALRSTLGKWDAVQEQFQARDREFQALTRRMIATRLAQRPVSAGINAARTGGKTELALLQHQIGLQVPRGSVRDVLSRAANAVLALKPCFMMGPLAVSQYLARGKFQFDLLVLDEASQMRPEDALGAMARCRQCVIVGDNKQLPPTSFFESNFGDDHLDDDENVDLAAIQESESILDAAAGLYQPARLLRWHYRSRHPSLIAFSNAEFYDNELILFPSVHEKSPEYGVKFIEVAGQYAGSKNEIEAAAVVEAVMDHLRHRPGESLGVVAMNSVQSALIEDLLETGLKHDAVAQAGAGRLETDRGERVFVKNLENVQGDERDVIFISITYGRNPQGVLHRNFGPINGRNGGRRLNVLFSRARKRVHVYSSFRPDELKLTSESSAGAQSLQRYLEFARTGRLPSTSLPPRPPDSVFEQQVIAAVQSLGFDCQPQLGVAGYFIDLAVRDPDQPGSFILAIECDGASYHSSKSARDRDRLRQSILEGMGWRVHRVWSTDWFRNPQGELTRIREAIAAAGAARARGDGALMANTLSPMKTG
ncbi:MAG: DUF4011 domain-containing protein [Verrucomicrobia bacterium]|nr:DUF4011 domain-containing protein [Verrucomicrobiota bacterium]